MAKEKHDYAEIEQRRPKAILVRLDKNDSNSVWFPLHRVELDEHSKTIACTPKLWEEKQHDRNRDWKDELDQKRKAKREYQQELLPLYDVEFSESGKAIYVNGWLDEEITDAEIRRRFYFPVSQVKVIDDVHHIPRWLAIAKAGEVAYEFLSSGGDKGIDHLGGTCWQAHFCEHSFYIERDMLYKAKERY